MIITKMALPRRTFLRGLGATLALPLLDAMVPALSRARADARPQPVTRIGVLLRAERHHPADFLPTEDRAGFELSPHPQAARAASATR